MTVESPETVDELTLEHLYLIAGGHTAFQLLWAGIELDLFTLLSREPDLRFDDIADRLGLAQQPARILLVGLAALKLIKKQKDRYRNAALTEQMLVRDAPGNAADVLGWQRYIVYPGLENFVDALKENRNIGLDNFPGGANSLYERLAENDSPVSPRDNRTLEGVFQDAMSALSRQANGHLINSFDMSDISYLVDAGGGDATNLIAIASKYPNMRASVFDIESVCTIATEKIKGAGLEERIDIWPGDLFSDPFPAAPDAILLAHMLTIWSPEKNKHLLHRCYEALPKGGRVIIFNMMADDDDTGPLETALGSPYFLAIATGEGMLYPWMDYETWLKDVGFLAIERYEDLPLNHGVIVGVK